MNALYNFVRDLMDRAAPLPLTWGGCRVRLLTGSEFDEFEFSESERRKYTGYALVRPDGKRRDVVGCFDAEYGHAAEQYTTWLAQDIERFMKDGE